MKKKTLVKLVCTVSIVASPLVGFAADTSGVEGTAVKTVNPSVNQASNNAAKENKTGQVLSYMASAAEFTIAAANVSPCSDGHAGACAKVALYTIMGIQSMMQGNEHGNKAADAGYTAGLTDAYSTGNYDPTAGTSSSSLSSMGDSYLKKAEAGLSSLKSQGLVNSSATKVTTPDGKSYNISDMTSPAAMEAAGIPKGAVDAAMAAYAQIEKKGLEKIKIGSQTASNGYEEGGGGAGGGSGSESGSGGADGAYAAGGYGSGKSLLNRDPSSLAAGMSKNYNGEPIGVAADSIFLMMNRRYKVKESQDSFFGIGDFNLKK
ncbi:MAG: hypothetical protein J7501_01210 [Bdellovibrio sp.]|nr:hypothetical protein [Bdellovibrio sp.]